MSIEPNEFLFRFNFLNWNVRGLGDLNKCMVVKNTVLVSKCDILCFQETKWCEHSIFRIRQVCPAKFKEYVTLDAEGLRGGILLAWSDSNQLLNSYIRKFTVTVIVQRGDVIFMINEVYGPQLDSQKIEFLTELKEIRGLNMLPWIIMGDFNIICFHEETTGGPPNLGISLAFNNTIEDLDLFDVPLVGKKFTWSNKRPQPTFSRLDRVLISPYWNSMGVSYDLQDATITVSDHSPLIFQLKPHQHNTNRPFRFETYWLHHPGLQQVV